MVTSTPTNVTELYAKEAAARILLVDDEMNNRKLLRRILTRNVEVIEAASGQEALALLRAHAFDVVLLDIMMPDITGLEVLAFIRNNPETHDLPVILISALSENDDIVRGLEMGANDYIPKPIDLDVVRARVSTQLKLKHMSDAHKQIIAELENAQKLKDRLFRIASHDLKSPLANVRMVESLLREFVSGEPKALEILDLLRGTVDDMKKVIEDFLDMAACQSNGIDLYLTDVEVHFAVMSAAMQYSLVAAEKNIALEIGDLPGIVCADQARLNQVLNNLVSNAIKYSPKHTTVTLWSEVIEDKVRIYIADQGPGIPRNGRELLFKEFSKLSTRPTGGESSTGLGLWIVKHMMILQKGTIGVECPSEGGSIFWIELPDSARSSVVYDSIAS